MKRNYIGWAAAAAIVLLLSACEREKEINGYVPGENELAFRIGSISTRSAAEAVQEETTVIPFGNDGQGNQLFLEESMVDLNAPVTRGTPAYTENVWALYKSFAAYIPTSDSATKTYSFNYDKTYATDEGSGYWTHAFGKDPWKYFSNPLELYMRMPEDMTSNGVSNLGYADGETTFSYTSPSTAQEQQDILFAYDSVKDSDYETGRDITFYHALTGVKFATANHISGSQNGTKTYITKVEFSGLVNSGTCKMSLKDLQSTTKSKNITEWDRADTASFSQTFTEENYAENIYKDSDYSFPDSFYAEDKATGLGKKSSDWNINDQNATLTFWFIPQTLSDDVELKITFYIDAGGRISEPITRKIKLGELTNHANWQAGQLRTYVLKANEVDVEITDELASNVKQNVKITNLGNVPQYVRAMIVAYWATYDETGNDVAVFGYNADSVEGDETSGYTLKDNPKYVEPWDLSKELAAGDDAYGTITDFYAKTDATNWATGNDGYYYYKKVIGVDEAYTKVLFKSYKLNKTPEIYQIDQKTLKIKKVANVHLVMDLVCQAVIAKDDVKWNDAWKAALGYDPSN